MLELLKLRNLTVFSKADFTFTNGLNVIVGENGTGKTHLLKIAYAIKAASASGSHPSPSKTHHETRLAEKLLGVFRPDKLGHLVRQDSNKRNCEVECVFSNSDHNIQFAIEESSDSDVSINLLPKKQMLNRHIYFPSRELLSIYPGFASLYETSHIPFEETWRDTCILLGAPRQKNVREGYVKELLDPLEEALGGKVELDKKGGFYLILAGERREIHLVAEGHRKLAMLAQLISNASLYPKCSLFWDEPEANLNPRVIQSIAKVILHLCKHNIQVFLASHSLFLMRELDILLQSKEFDSVPARFFGLHSSKDGVRLEQGSCVDDIGEIASLQEELSQSDRYLQSGV